jgi:hypothetical protein
MGRPEAFPSPMTREDLATVTIDRPHVAPHFQDVLERLPEDDEFRAPLRAMVDAWRLSRTPRVRQLTDRVADLEQQLATSRDEPRAMEESRSWRVTRPLRAATDRLHGRRRASRGSRVKRGVTPCPTGYRSERPDTEEPRRCVHEYADPEQRAGDARRPTVP